MALTPADGLHELTKVKGTLLLNVVIRERTAILKLLTSEDKALLIGRNSR